ncbi:MAG: thiamine pyrophosphate-binding protein [Acidimicrobiales bacterium]
MSRVDGGVLCMRALAREGVTHVFSLGGGHINTTWYAIRDNPGMTLVDVRHEGAAVYAAEGWALATGRTGTCLVTAGPGVTNSMTGLADAQAGGIPIVCIAGAASLRGQDAGEVESLEQLEMVRPVVKWARRVHHLDRIPEYVHLAFRMARAGRPGPVYLELAIDLVHSDIEETEVPVPLQLDSQAGGGAGSERLVGRAAELLSQAARPAIIAGGGVWWADAGEALRAVVEHTGIPLVTRNAARGTVPDDHPLCLGSDWENLVTQADVLLVIGKQLDYFFGYGRFTRVDHLIQVDINPAEIGRNNAPVSVGIVGDAAAVLGQLTDTMKPLQTAEWVRRLTAQAEEAEHHRQRAAGSAQSPIHPLRVFRELQDALPRDATIVPDGAFTMIWANAALRAWAPGRISYMTAFGNIGYGVAHALAAGLARPGSPVVWAVGDGSFGFNAMELDTAARFGVPVVAVIFDNKGWSADWVPLGVRPYEKLAPGFDGYGELVEHAEQFRPALERALSSGGPAILNVVIEPHGAHPPGRYLGP